MKKISHFFIVIILGWFLLSANTVYADQFSEPTCGCRTVLEKLDKKAVLVDNKILNYRCVVAADKKCFPNDALTAEDRKKLKVECERHDTSEKCSSAANKWNEDLKKFNISQTTKMNVESTAKSSISDLIVKCGRAGTRGQWDEKCKDVTVFLYLIFDLIDYVLGIIGAVILGVFVYGGFKLIISQGNPDKVQEGTGAMVNAIIGLFICFTAYVLVSYVGQVFGVKSAFSLISF